jgi:hypothetical protein
LTFNDLIFSLIQEQLAIIGRANIAKRQQEQLANIETKRQAALTQLNIKYAAADKVKKSFGYIGIISLSFLYGIILLNDLAKLIEIVYEDIKAILRNRKEMSENEKLKDIDETDQITIELEKQSEYSRGLEEKLDKFHLQLVKALVKSKKNY